MRSLTLAFLTAFTFAFAQPSPQPNAGATTYGDINGRAWNVASKDAKLFYLMGVAEGIVRASPDTFTKTYMAGTLSNDEVRTAIDRFFAEPENLLIPVIDALHIVSMKANGALQSEIDTELSMRRAISVRWHQEHK